MESRSLKEVAYSSIKKRILSGVLAPGDVISERTFVEELGISRTPVHEAMALLAEEGLVRIMPSRGMVVSPISMKDIGMVYQARMIIEPAIVRILASLSTEPASSLRRYLTEDSDISYTADGRDLDSEFHIALSEATGNTYLVNMEKRLLAQCQRIRIISTREESIRNELAREEHGKIVDAIAMKDGAKAASMALHHLERTLEDYSRILSLSDSVTI